MGPSNEIRRILFIRGVHDDSLLTSGSEMVFSARCVESTHDKILCDDVYQTRNTKLAGTWPKQRIVPTTYVADSTRHYNDPLSEAVPSI